MRKIGVAALSAALAVSVAPPLAFADDVVELDDSDVAVSYVSEDSLPTVVDADITAERKILWDKKANGTWSFEDGVLTISNSTSLGSSGRVLTSPSEDYLRATKKLVIADGTSDVIFQRLFGLCPNAEELSLPKSCTVLPDLAGLRSLSKISYPDGCGITSLTPGAFAWAGEDPDFYGPQFDVVDLSKLPLTEIPKGTFAGSHVTEVLLPDTLQEIKSTAFTRMEYLKSIEIPSSVKKIATDYDEKNNAGLFEYDKSLSTVVMYDTVETVEGPFWKFKANGTTIEVFGTNDLSDSFYKALSAIPSDGTVKFQQVFNVNPDEIEAIADNVQPVDTQWVEMGTGLDAAGAEASNAPVLSCDGYAFTGWYSDAECTTPYDFTAPMEHGAVAYAGWKQIVSVDVNYGNGSENGTITADENGMIAKPDTDPVRAGYKFTGWFSDEACTTEFDFTKPVVDGACLYAGWKQIVSVDVNYGNGSENGTITADENDMIAKPDTDPVRAGYKFTRWFSDEACTTEFDFTKPVVDGACLYAGWTPVKAIVSNVDGTKTDLQVKSDGTIAEPMAPTRDGYVFKGWYSDPYCTRAFDFEQPLYDDVTLYSKWEAKASEPTPSGTTDTGNTGSGGNVKQPAAQPNGSQNGNGIQQTNSASNAGAQTLAQTGDAATGAVPAVAFVSAMAAAVVAFARKRIARR